VSGLLDVKRIKALWAESKPSFAMYLGYMGLMLTLGAAEGLMASVAIFYAIKLVSQRLAPAKA